MKTIEEIARIIDEKFDTYGLIQPWSDAYDESERYDEFCAKIGESPELDVDDFRAYIERMADGFVEHASAIAYSAMDDAGATDWESYDPCVHDGVAIAAIVSEYELPSELYISLDCSPGTVEDVADAAACATLRAMRRIEAHKNAAKAELKAKTAAAEEEVDEILGAKRSLGDDAYLFLNNLGGEGDCILWPSEAASIDDDGSRAERRWTISALAAELLIQSGEIDEIN